MLYRAATENDQTCRTVTPRAACLGVTQFFLGFCREYGVDVPCFAAIIELLKRIIVRRPLDT